MLAGGGRTRGTGEDGGSEVPATSNFIYTQN